MGTHFLLQDMAIVMVVAAATTLVCHRFRQPVVLGYLLAGLIMGPHTPPLSFVKDIQSIHTMAELGLVFLMFALGLEFNLPKLRRVGLPAAVAAVVEVVGMISIGYGLGRLFGWTPVNSFFLGAILSISSTTIIVKVFADLGLTKEAFAQTVFGILILEDIVAVLLLSIISGLGVQTGGAASLLFTAMFKIGLYVVLFLLGGLLLVPRFLHRVAGFRVKEVLGIVTLGLCLLGAWSASWFGFSVALGAFLAGAVIAASSEIEEIEEWIHPIRDMFSAIFFVSAGMLIQPEVLWTYRGPILIVTAVTILGKALSGSVGALLAGYPLKSSFRIGMSMAQIGEFSFVIASLGIASGVADDFLYPLAVAVSSVTTLCTPYLIRGSDKTVERVLRFMPPSFQEALDRYRRFLAGAAAGEGHHQRTAILSKYLVRLVAYAAVFLGLLLIAKGLSHLVLHRPAVQAWSPQAPAFLLWTVTALLCLPLFATLTRYSNHLLLLWVTQSPWVLRLINIRHFYNVLLILLYALLSLLFLFLASAFVTSFFLLVALVVSVSFLAWIARRRVDAATERLEGWLDEVLGLATSEPTRKALRAAEQTAFLHGVMEPVALTPGAPALESTLRALRLRERTGVSVVAIYRHGNHLSNPSPDTVLEPNDVLMVIGNADERGRAKEILIGVRPAEPPHAGG